MKRRITNRAMIFSLIFGIVLIGKGHLMTNHPSMAAGQKETAMLNTAMLAAPTLGNYPDAAVMLGGSTTVTPDATPLNATSINVVTNTNFKGTFAADPATGIVRVTNAHPAGAYPVTVTAFDSMGATTTKSFTLTVDTSTACTVTPTFTSAADVGVGSLPSSVAIGDFNGDGKQDFAAANEGSGTVSIRLGDGMGGFSGTTNVGVGSGPVSVAVGDFNGDGKQDFAAANRGSDTVSIRLGDGLGGFSGTTNVSVGSAPWSVAIGDFNGDGKQDFAAAKRDAATVSIRLGDGLGGFSGTTEVGGVSSPLFVVIGDFNGDGKQDLAIASGLNIAIRLGDGLGGFSGTTNVSIGSSVISVAIGDFNGDGKQDFVAGVTGTASQYVYIRLGDGLGGFSGTTEVQVGDGPKYVTIGDFNGDGKQDLAATNDGSSSVSIRLGDGLGGFSGGTDLGVGLAPRSVAIGDFNGDGKQDFATANKGGNVSIRLGACSTPLTLGNYPNATVTLGGSTTVTPAAAPLNATSIQVATNTNFKGTFTADPATGIVQVTNAHPVGTYPVTVTAFNGTQSVQRTFTLTVQPGPACNATTIFTNAADVGVGSAPTSVAIGDFDGDGKQDFAVANLNSNTVSIRLGDGLGGFSGTTNVGVGSSPLSVAIGDFNGDGKQDFAAANNLSNNVSIRLGDGLGGFSGTTDVGVGSRPHSVAIGDFNGDGRQDFATANLDANTVSIRLGDGLGGFSGTTDVSVGAAPYSVTIGDFNGDGKQDFAAANNNSGTVSIRLGDGLGGFSGMTSVGVGTLPTSVAIGDFNGDGKQDFAAANQGSDTVSIRLGDGLGRFSGTTEVSVGTGPQSVAIGDFNGDGKQDFAAANSGSANVSIRLGDGLGGFSGTTTVGVGSLPTSVAIGDFNGDGRQDFATADANFFGTVSIRLGACQPALGNYPNAIVTLGGSATVTPNATPLSATSIQVATNTNFKGTLVADLATGIVRVTNAHPAGTYPVTVTAFNGTLSGQKNFTLTVQPGPACSATTIFTGTTSVGVGTGPNSVSIGDFNGDGKQDFAVANQNSNTVSIRLGDGLGGFTGTTNVSVGSNPLSVAIGDFNGDGKQDFAAANYVSNTVSIRLGDGMGGFSGMTDVGIGTSPVSIAIGDFNGDGKQDFATANSNANTVSIRLGDGLGGFSGATNVGVGSTPVSVAIGDFNVDGKQDFAAVNYFSDNVSIRLGDGMGGFSGTTNVGVGSVPESVAIGDFNGDGKQDFAVANQNSNTVSIRLGDGMGGFSGTTNVGVGSDPYSVSIGDFNGDGKQDFAAANAGSGTVSIRLGDGMGGFSGTTNVGVGVGPHSVAIGDFNGDGRQDFAAANYLSNTVSIRLGGCDLPPTLTPTGLALTAGQTANAATIGNTADALDAANTLQLSISSDGGMTFGNTATLNGMTVTLTDSNGGATGINPNAMGQVIADASASLTATDATFKLRVTDSSGNTDTQNLSVTINCPTITVTPATAANGFVGTAYSQTFTQTGGNGTITWSSTGTLPDGLTLNPSTGELAGTPTALGSFTFTVRATDQNNCFGETQYTVVISGNGLMYYPLPKPIRLFDTRAPIPGFPACEYLSQPLVANGELVKNARITCDSITIPANAAAIVGNATVITPATAGFITLWPDGQARPPVSNLNFTAGQVVPTAFTVGLSGAGDFRVYSTSIADFALDVTGYFAPPSASGLYYHPLPRPIRLFDTRAAIPGFPACEYLNQPLVGGGELSKQARITCDGITIPADAMAIVGNATVVTPSGNGFITLWPDGQSRPPVSNLNFVTGQVVPNAFTVSLGGSGEFRTFSASNTDFIVDITGYYSPSPTDANGAGLLYSPLSKPIRLFDTRATIPGFPACEYLNQPLIADGELVKSAHTTCDSITIPATAAAIVGNATVVSPAANGFITLWPDGQSRPPVSNLNYLAGQVVPNAFTVGLNVGGSFRTYSFAGTDFIVDITGFFAP
ncbi:MAG: beta strand repeat-containing protein [Blastocatellales bacterium]